MRYRANLIGLSGASALAACAAAWGWFDAGGIDPYQPGHATAVIAGVIGLLLMLPLIPSALATGARAAAVRANPTGRWFAGPADIAAFREWERRNGIVNEWRPTRGERARGIEVCWAGDMLVVGGHCWRLAPGQYPSVRSIEARAAPPGSVALRYGQIWVHNMSSRDRLVHTEREFRFPAPDEAQARALVRHVTPLLGMPQESDGRRRRARLVTAAWIAAAVFGVLLATGLGFGLHDRANGVFRAHGERAALIAATVLGIMGTPAMLLILWSLRRRGG